MNDRARDSLAYARQALKDGEMVEARVWGERAAQLAPESEDPWLVLAATGSPRESVEYLQKALELNPNSPRALKGLDWATKRLGQSPQTSFNSRDQGQVRVAPDAPVPAPEKDPGAKVPRKRNLLPILLIVMGCAVFSFAAWSAVNSPVLAGILNNMKAPQAAQQPAHLQSFAQVAIAKPVVLNMPLGSQPDAQVIEPTATIVPTSTLAAPENTQAVAAVIVPSNTQPVSLATVVPMNTPPVGAGVVPTATQIVQVLVVPADTSVPPTPGDTSVPGAVSAEIVVDTPTSEYAAAATAPAYVPPASVGGGEHWIDVNLSQQRVYAYAGDTVVNSFLVSTGTWQTPTVTGQYHVYVKLLATDMSGPGYYLPDVPYTMYFYKGYGLHGTYWHHNFGTPMSHGCVNLATPDAEWLYNFSSVGTLVNVHY